MTFADRTDAGRRLAERLSRYAGRPDLLVLGLPRGGVPVAAAIAERLGAPLDVFLVRKLGTPGEEELAMGAIASGGVRVLNPRVVEGLGISAEAVEAAARREEEELARRERLYRKNRPPLALSGKTVVLVDDGLATGSTMRAAVAAARRHGPSRVIVAVPVAPAQTCRELAGEADDVICLSTPTGFLAVGQWYVDFPQLTDAEVIRILEAPHPAHAAAPGGRT